MSLNSFSELFSSPFWLEFSSGAASSCFRLVTDTIGIIWSLQLITLSWELDVEDGRCKIYFLRRAPALGCSDAKGKAFSSKTISRDIHTFPVDISRHFTPLWRGL
jgi:hypothetical protein